MHMHTMKITSIFWSEEIKSSDRRHPLKIDMVVHTRVETRYTPILMIREAYISNVRILP